MKIKDLSNREMKEICDKIKVCKNCPLARWENINGTETRVMCYLKARAISIASIQDYKMRKEATKDFIEKDYLEDRAKEEIKKMQERELKEIDYEK